MFPKPRRPFVGFCISSSVPGMSHHKDVKERVREYMERRQSERRQNARSPIPGPEQIRQEIGWGPVERRQRHRRG